MDDYRDLFSSQMTSQLEVKGEFIYGAAYYGA